MDLAPVFVPMFPGEMRVCFDSRGHFGRAGLDERVAFVIQAETSIQRALGTLGRVHARDESVVTTSGCVVVR